MSDLSDWESKYFIDPTRYNCPFCNVRSIGYYVEEKGRFDWDSDKVVYFYTITCNGCEKTSLHLSNYIWDIQYENPFKYKPDNFKDESEYEKTSLDQYFFYHQPTSFFTIDDRIPKVIRDLVGEAEGCRSMNFMVGASGALRKSIYKFLKDQKANEQLNEKGQLLSYEDKIKWVKNQKPKVSEELFDAIAHVQDMTSEELHEEKEWEPWRPKEFDFMLAAMKALLHEVYVLPDEKKQMLNKVLGLRPKNNS